MQECRLQAILSFAEFAWICYDWSGIKVRMFGTAEAYEKLGKEFALMTLSHRGDLDWVAGYVVSTQFDFIHVSTTVPTQFLHDLTFSGCRG